MKRDSRQWLMLAIFVSICLAVGGFGSIYTESTRFFWYETLRQPDWRPPDWLFAPVWTFLYLSMAVAAWLVWRNARYFAQAAGPLILFGIQLALNLAWSGIFFALRAPGAAFAEIIILWAAILATLIAFWRVKPVAGLLLIPYLLWVTYASALNYSIWQLNA